MMFSFSRLALSRTHRTVFNCCIRYRSSNNYNVVSRKQQRPTKSNNSTKKFQPNFIPPQDEIVKNFLDDELYNDHDFDYGDSENAFNLDKYKSRNYNYASNRRNHKLNKKTDNALFDDDEDDVKLLLAQNNRNIHQRSIKDIHSKFEKEIKLNTDFNVIQKLTDENTFQSNKLKRKLLRSTIPLPYNITEDNRFDILNQIVIPYYDIPYNFQLKKKYNTNVEILRHFSQKLQANDVPIKINQRGLPCILETVRPSPMIEQYRNKDEFSVWPGIDGNSKTVGFFVGQQSLHDRVICVEPDHMIITKQSHIYFAKKFQQYLRDVSPYDYCQNYGLAGHWRRIHIRSNDNGEHMITVIMHPQELSQEELTAEMERIRSYFADEPQVKSLYFHASRHTRSTHTGEQYNLLSGEPIIHQGLFDKKFVISPSSFFQVNTTGAEVLYRTVMTEIGARRNTILLDLCCGTGALSILLSDQVKQVIAIDSSASAIEDAKMNASANNAGNITFMHGTVEEMLAQIDSQTLHSGDVIAVANPSRRALHPSAIRSLLSMGAIQKLIYVSCKADGTALRNFIQLCRPNTEHTPFLPVTAIPVDLFPHTDHCELVITFERMPQ